MSKGSLRKFIMSIVVAVICVVAGFVAGWELAPTEVVEVTPTLPPIKVGAPLPMTGPFSDTGREQYRGIEMAVDEINARGGLLGREVKIIVADAEDWSPDKVVSAFEYLCSQEKVDFMAYIWGVVYGPNWDILAKYKVPCIHLDVVEDFRTWYQNHPEDGWVVFMGTPTDSYYGKGFVWLTNYLIAQGLWHPRNKKIALIRGEDVYGQRIAEVFKNEMVTQGWEVILDETVTFGTVEYGPILSKIRAESPDIILNTDLLASDLAKFMTQFRENPAPSLFFTPYGAGAPEFIELGKENVEGVIWSTVIGPLPGSLKDRFDNKYREKYHEEPSIDAAFAYDVVMCWATAVALVGTTEPRAVCTQIEQMAYKGICGTFFFNEEHWINPYPEDVDDPAIAIPHQFLQIQNLTNQVILPHPYNTSTFQLPPWF